MHRPLSEFGIPQTWRASMRPRDTESGGLPKSRTALAAFNETLDEHVLHPTKGPRLICDKRRIAALTITPILQARAMRRVSETAGINTKYPAEKCRRLRALRGVGRPPRVLAERSAA